MLVIPALTTAADPPGWTKVAQWKAELPPPDPTLGKLFTPALAISPQADVVAVGTPGSPDVQLHALRTGKLVGTLKGHQPPRGAIPGDPAGSVVRLAFSADGHWVFGLQAFGPPDYSSNWYDKLGCVNLWKTDGSEHHVVPVNEGEKDALYGVLEDVAASPMGTAFVIAGVNRVLVGDLKTPDHVEPKILGALVGNIKQAGGPFPVRAAFSPDGSKLAVGFNRLVRDEAGLRYVTRPARLAVWDLSKPDDIPMLTYSPMVGNRLFSRIDELRFTPDGQQVLAVGDGAWLWSLANKQSTPLELPAPYEATYAAGLTADSKRLIAAGLGTEPYRKTKNAGWPKPLPEPLEKAAYEARLVTLDLASRKAGVELRPGLRCAAWHAGTGTLVWMTRAGAVTVESPPASPASP